MPFSLFFCLKVSKESCWSVYLYQRKKILINLPGRRHFAYDDVLGQNVSLPHSSRSGRGEERPWGRGSSTDLNATFNLAAPRKFKNQY